MKNNSKSVGIALVGNFNHEKPTKQQYEALNLLLEILKSQFTDAVVKPHWSWGSSCPGKYFDKLEIKDFLYISDKRVQKTSILGTYEITRYYSPEVNQKEYFISYTKDITINCGKSALYNDGCKQPAYGGQYTEQDQGKVVACGVQFPAYTQFHIKGYGWVTCRDRGSAIIGKKLDLRAGMGDQGYNYIKNTKRPAGAVEVDQVLFPKK